MLHNYLRNQELLLTLPTSEHFRQINKHYADFKCLVILTGNSYCNSSDLRFLMAIMSTELF